VQVVHKTTQDRRTAYVLTDGDTYVVEIYPGDNCMPYVTRKFQTLADAMQFAKLD
jgi:hypothetical protein